ncbi:MAG: hypothetical protein RLZZ227_1608 [Pseudomonadota bacterium]
MKLLNQKQLAIVLVLLGAVPFVLLTAQLIGLAPFLPVFAAPAVMLHAYGVVVGSFIAGLQWGIHFCKRTSDSVYLFSSFVALLLWCSMLAAGAAMGLALVALSFVLLWCEEYRLSAQRVTTAWFWKLRCAVTATVLLCLALAMMFV